MRVAAVAAVLLAACQPFAVTPPARTFALDSPITPAPGHGDVQLQVATAAQPVFGPGVDAAGGQLRTSIAPNVAVVASAERLVEQDGPSQSLDHEAYSGRIGGIVTTDGHHAALTFGAGAGTAPAAGSWGSADLGGVVSGKNHWIRPVLAMSFGYNAPFSRKPFTVTDDDGENPVTLQLPSDLTYRVDLGLELGPPRCTLVLGMSFIQFWMLEPDVLAGPGDSKSEEAFFQLGLAVRVALD